MKSNKIILFLLGFLFLAQVSLEAKEAIILYTGQTHAMLYPCSCPIQQDGGIARRATLVKELRKKFPALLLLDCGNFTAGGQLDEYTQNIQLDMQRSEVNFKALALMKYDAVGIGSDEFNFGREFFLKNVKQDSPAYLAVNLGTDKVLPYIIKDSGGVKIALIGLAGLAAKQKTEGLKISPPEEVARIVNRLRIDEGAQVLIILSTQGESEDLKLISKVKGIDIIFVGERPLKEEVLTKVSGTFFLRPAWQGRKLGKLTLKIDQGRLTDCKAEELALSEELKTDAEIASILPRCYADSNCKNGDLAGTCENPGQLDAVCSFTKPNPVDLFIINVKDCVTCDAAPVVTFLKKKFPGLTIRNLDYPSSAAQKMIEDLTLAALPAYIFPRAVENEENFESLKDELRLINDFYVFKPRSSGISYFLNQKEKKENFDLFFSVFDPDASVLLSTLKEFNPNLHFLVSENEQGLDAKNGIAETQECLRAVCVQNYEREKFWDYLICRTKNIQSSYWEDCLGAGVDSSRIKNCARGEEGIKLLRENISLNKQLQISSGPSYLVNNQEIFSSRGVPSKEEFRKILKK